MFCWWYCDIRVLLFDYLEGIDHLYLLIEINWKKRFLKMFFKESHLHIQSPYDICAECKCIVMRHSRSKSMPIIWAFRTKKKEWSDVGNTILRQLAMAWRLATLMALVLVHMSHALAVLSCSSISFPAHTACHIEDRSPLAMWLNADAKKDQSPDVSGKDRCLNGGSGSCHPCLKAASCNHIL